MTTTSITYAEFRARVRNAILAVLAGLPDTTYNEDPFENRVSHGELLHRIDSRYHLELRDELDHLVSGGTVMRTTTGEGDLFSLTPWFRWDEVVEVATRHGGWLSTDGFIEALESRPQGGLQTALDALFGWGVLEVKRSGPVHLYRYSDPAEVEDESGPTPAEERQGIRRFLYEAHQRSVAEYNEVGGANDTWDLVDRLEEEGNDMASIGRLLLAEFLDGHMDGRHAVQFRVSTVPATR